MSRVFRKFTNFSRNAVSTLLYIFILRNVQVKHSFRSGDAAVTQSCSNMGLYLCVDPFGPVTFRVQSVGVRRPFFSVRVILHVHSHSTEWLPACTCLLTCMGLRTGSSSSSHVKSRSVLSMDHQQHVCTSRGQCCYHVTEWCSLFNDLSQSHELS